MSVPNALILWPVRFASTAYVLRVTINGTTTNLNFPATGSLTVGRDYFMSGDARADGTTASNNGHGDLISMLQATIRTHANGGAATVAFDSSFKILVTFGGGFGGQMLWAHGSTTLDDAVFGFNGNTSTAISATSPNVPMGIFRPNRPIANDGRDRQGIVGGIARTMTGKVRVSRYALPAKERDLSFQYLNQNVALTEYLAGDNPTGSLEYAWINAFSLGRYFRLYEDESSRTTTSYKLYQIANLEDDMMRTEAFKIWWDRPLKTVLAEIPS
jgi:hypothetical protein